MTAPTLRPGTPADAPAVAVVWHAAWHDGHAGHVPDGVTASRTLESFHLRTPDRVDDTAVAVVDGVVAGFVMVAGDEVEQVFVDAEHRGTDVAALLLAEGERRVAAAGYDEAWLAVAEGNARARRFYEKRGWRDGGALPLPAVAVGDASYVVDCRRYVKAVTPPHAG